MGKEIFEQVVIDANVSLKRWEMHQDKNNYLLHPEMVRSMILSWLNRAYTQVYSNHANWRERRAVSRGLHNGVFYSVARDNGIHIVSIDIHDPSQTKLSFPELDYDRLNELAKAKLQSTPFVHNINDLSFESIERIKFT